MTQNLHFSHHVLDSWLEVAEEGFGLVSLHLAILDGLPTQEVVHLDSEDGGRATLVLAAGITCAGRRTGILFHRESTSPTNSVDPLTHVLPDNGPRVDPDP